MLSVNKKGWVGSGGGGSGSITDAQNIGFGEGVFAGKSGALNEVLDFKSLTGSNGIIVSSGADEVDISGSGLVGTVIPALQSFVEGTGNNPNKTLSPGSLYAGVIPWGDGIVNAVQVWIEVLGVTPSAFTVGIYDDTGAKIGAATYPQTPFSTGNFYIFLNDLVSLSRNRKYFVGLAATGNSEMNADAASTNSTSWNFFKTGENTIPAGSISVGAAVSDRIWFRLVRV